MRYLDGINNGLMVPIISVYGRSGSGKSTVVRFICDSLSDTMSYSFVNLRKARTLFGCANLILAGLGEKNLKSAQGLNAAVDVMETKIQEILASEKKKFFVLVLDEYDSVFSDSRGNPSDFVYKLLTLEENLREKDIWLCIITISNNAVADYDLDDRVKSRMGSSEIFFEPYATNDVLSILQDRSRLAFVCPISDDILEHCAKLSSTDHGDARRALDLLRVAAEMSNGKITKQDIDNALEQNQKDRINVIISSATYHLRVIIASICSLSILTESGWHATSTIYKKYCLLLEDNKKPLSYRRITDLLTELQNLGLVKSQTRSRGRYGYGTEFCLRFSPDMVGPLVSKEWWDGLVADKKQHDALMSYVNPLAHLNPTIAKMNKNIKTTQDIVWRKRMGLDDPF